MQLLRQAFPFSQQFLQLYRNDLVILRDFLQFSQISRWLGKVGFTIGFLSLSRMDLLFQSCQFLLNLLALIAAQANFGWQCCGFCN